MTGYHFIGRLFCEKSVLIWKIYFSLILLIFTLLTYSMYNFTFFISNEFSKYSWNQQRNFISFGKAPTALLNFQVDFMLNRGMVSDNPSEILGATFQWCPDLKDTPLERLFENLTRSPKDPPCSALFTGHLASMEGAKNWTSPCTLTDAQTAYLSDDCKNLKRSFGFNTALYEWELQAANFSVHPLAFVVLAGEKNAHQFYRLMSAIYRPWNAYCLTYDNDGSADFKRAIKNFDRCFDNVVMPDRFFHIKWASFTILESSMECLKILNDFDTMLPWNYAQFISWNDFPLRTMPEIVEITKILNGSQDVELTRGQIERHATTYERYHVEAALDENRRGHVKPVPPGDLVIYKGSMAATLSRPFVDFLFSNKIARQFFNWCRSTYAAEEQFWSTLAHNLHLGAPGAFTAACLPYYEYKRPSKSKPFISRHQIWYENCAGKLISGSCVFGVGDLPKLIARPEIFAHKVYTDFEPATYYCLSEWYHEKSYRPYIFDGLVKNQLINWSSQDNIFDPDHYRNLPGVRYHHLVDKLNFTC